MGLFLTLSHKNLEPLFPVASKHTWSIYSILNVLPLRTPRDICVIIGLLITEL